MLCLLATVNCRTQIPFQCYEEDPFCVAAAGTRPRRLSESRTFGLMKTTPLIILGSARKESDTRKFLDLIFADINHTLVDLLDYKISGYHYPHHYSEDDQYEKVIDELLNHELIVFASPVYWYSMSSLMKTFFDRFSDLVTYRKTIGRKLKGKSTALIAVGAEEKLPDGFEIPFSCTSNYLDMEYLGSIYHSIEAEAYNKSAVAKFREKLKIGN